MVAQWPWRVTHQAGGPPPAHWRPPLTHPPWRGWPPHAVCRTQCPRRYYPSSAGRRQCRAELLLGIFLGLINTCGNRNGLIRNWARPPPASWIVTNGCEAGKWNSLKLEAAQRWSCWCLGLRARYMVLNLREWTAGEDQQGGD